MNSTPQVLNTGIALAMIMAPAPSDSHPASIATTERSNRFSPLMSRKDAARYLGLAQQTLAQWACSGRVQLPMVKVGRKAQYKKTDLDTFISANTQVGFHA